MKVPKLLQPRYSAIFPSAQNVIILTPIAFWEQNAVRNRNFRTSFKIEKFRSFIMPWFLFAFFRSLIYIARTHNFTIKFLNTLIFEHFRIILIHTFDTFFHPRHPLCIFNCIFRVFRKKVGT